jgi:ketosteroid isomerase-like protein
LRFQTIERVPIEDSARVLAVLEQRLRAMVSNVEREGNRITLSGLGPSSRAINRHDTTVIDVWDENGVTTIGADVTFQALSFLGVTSQEEIMRLKLERLFEETKEQLDLERRHDVARIARMEALVGGSSTGLSRFVSSSADPSTAHAEIQQRPEDSSIADDPASPVEEREESVELQKTLIQEDVPASAVPASKEAPVIDFSAETGTVAPPTPASVTEESSSTFIDSEDEDPTDNVYDPQEVDEEKSNRWILWAVLAACIVAVLPFGLHYISTLRTDKAALSSAQVSSQEPATSVPAKPVAAAEPADLLRQWELAMRSRDAAAQAAFYAVPVDLYFLRHNVSKAQVEADKQQRIDSRKGIWTVKMEKVKISRNSDTTATVSLVKHYMQQEDGRPVKEWFVPSHLKLKSEYGVWWITSERDLFWATPPSED